ncbi:hypothetical protein ACKZDW_06515 (plasmid) [Ralstonia syzygii subsp. celebesensis]|nr:hypothetical protein [Ralstonia syzygii]QQV57389.1 hypothetical protein JK151_17930 [Ralstonia syzygii subsp. celebesensis]CCA82722.1 conserved hypothetical protein [blood disease bacterium R229]
MPINRAGSSRSSVVQEYVPLSDVRDSRLDAIVGSPAPTRLAVSKKTFEAMGIASRVVKKTGYETFPDGPANQEAAIWMSGGRSWARMKLARDMIEGGHCPDIAAEIKTIKEMGGGSCSEHRRLSAAELSQMHRSMPVIQVKESDEDHHYVVVGDWRDRTVGNHAVVVDPWHMVKKVYTYGERSNSTQPIPLFVTPPGPPVPDSAMSDALSASPASESKMDRFTKMRVKRPAGPQAAEAIINALRSQEPQTVWDDAAGTRNVHAEYVDPDGNVSAFNGVPPDYLDRYLDAKEQMSYALPIRG